MNDIALIGILQSGSGSDPCAGCDPYGPVSPPQYSNCRNIDGYDYYDQLYYDGCCGFVWITFEGACP